MLGCEGLGYSYPGAFAPALEDVTLSFGRGQVTGVAGVSGCGKSTLLGCLAGELALGAGTVRADGVALGPDGDARARRAYRTHVGLVHQLPELQLFGKTVADDVAFGPKNLGLPDDEVAGRVAWALEAVGLDSEAFGPRSPFALSGGEQRRAAIAGILALRPDYLLLDEPTAGLDPGQRDRLYGLARELADEGERMGVVVVSHDIDALTRHVDAAVLMGEGRVLAAGLADEVLGDAGAVRRARLEPAAEVELASRLRARGIDIPAGTLTARQLARALRGSGRGGEGA